ncbi:MAG TPA: glycosyltransferase family 9 protein [Candidatus Kapabacteria bacterium]|nr:glycosyltransferase family 9 protein [Candidatus Kapabacteria bacterium]
MNESQFFTPANIHLAKEYFISEINISKTFPNQHNFKEYIRRIFYCIVTHRIKPLEAKIIDLKKINDILIIRNDGIGDWIISTPIVEYIKQINPQINIDVLASNRNYDLVRVNPYIRNIYTAHHNLPINELISTALKIRKSNKYDLVICLKHTEFTKQLILLSIANLKNVPIISMGHSNPIRQKTYKLAFSNSTNIQEISYWSETLMELVRRNISGNLIPQIKPSVYFSKFNFDNITEILKKYNLKYNIKVNYNNTCESQSNVSNPQNYIIFNISGFESNRKLEENTIFEIVNTILFNFPNTMVFISGAENDIEKIEQIEQKINNKNCKGINLSIMNFTALLAGACCLISPDSGPVHLASALQVPIIAFYKTYEKLVKWQPLNSKFVAIVKSNISAINSNELQKAIELLRAQ